MLGIKEMIDEIPWKYPPSAYVSDPYPSCRPFAQVPSYLAGEKLLHLTPYLPLLPEVHSPLYTQLPLYSIPRPCRLPFCH